MSENHNLQTPGEIIAAARKQRSLTQAQVAERTKIPEAMIAAVEADEYHKISGDLYVVSFLRTISAVVGADADQVLDLYARLAGQEGGKGTGGTPVWDSEEVLVQRVGFAWRSWLLYACLGILVVLAILLLVRGCGTSNTANGQQQAMSASTRETAAAVVVDSNIAAGVSDVDSLAAGNPAEAEAAALPPCFANRDEIAFSGKPSFSLTLAVTTDHVVSIKVRADGQNGFHSADWRGVADDIPVLPPGDVTPGRVYRCHGGFVVFWGAADHFGLKLGDLEGVAVRLQGLPYTLDGLVPDQEIILDRQSVGR